MFSIQGNSSPIHTTHITSYFVCSTWREGSLRGSGQLAVFSSFSNT